jgi:hypothetical protein
LKKEIHPGIVAAVVVVILAVAGFFYYRSSAAPPAQAMSPLGPGAAALNKTGGDMSQVMTPAEKQMMQRSMGSHGGAPGTSR